MLESLKRKRKPQKTSPGQQKLPWDIWDTPNPEIQQIARKFILANCFNPDLMSEKFEIEDFTATTKQWLRCQVSDCWKGRKSWLRNAVTKLKKSSEPRFATVRKFLREKREPPTPRIAAVPTNDLAGRPEIPRTAKYLGKT